VAERLPLFDLLVDWLTTEWVCHASLIGTLLLVEWSHAEALVGEARMLAAGRATVVSCRSLVILLSRLDGNIRVIFYRM